MEEKADDLQRAVAQGMRERALATPGETVLVAVSGGADSVALLHILWSLRETLGIGVAAAHYEHGIRGDASVEDARFVQAFCATRGIRCIVGGGDVPALAAAWRTSLEDAARRARYAFLEETARVLGAEKIALAHQQEDQAETLLLHLTYGAGLQGISGMRWAQGNRIRPLLDVPRAALEAYLTSRGIAWREDETNADARYARNLLRHEVFPILRRLNPRVSEAMARTAALAAQAVDAQTAQARGALDGRVKRMPYGAFWVCGGEITPEAARAFTTWAGVPVLDARQTAALTALSPGEMTNLPAGWRALRTRERLHLLHGREVRAELADIARMPAPPGTLGDGIRAQVLDADRAEGAVLRTRRDGDVFAPIGMRGTQKLKDTLREAGIDRPFRDLAPLLARGERVLWIIGVKASRDAAVTADTARRTLYQYHGTLPWEMNGGQTHD